MYKWRSKGGRKNVVSGHLKRVASLGGRAGGRISGSISLRRMRELYPEKLSEWARKGASAGAQKGGLVGGHRCRELHPEQLTEMAYKGGPRRALTTNHYRWHIARGIINPKCVLCANIS